MKLVHLCTVFIVFECISSIKGNDGMALLEPHITSGLGVAFKADNGQYWSLIIRENQDIEAAKSTKDDYTKFTILKIDNDHVYLKNDWNGKYLSRITRENNIDYIEAAKILPDIHCVFQVLTDSGKVMFKANSGKFLSRVTRSGQENIEAAKNGPDPYTKFDVETGTKLAVTEEIVSVSWKTFNSPTTINPTALVSQEVINGGSRDLIKTFTLENTIERSQQTNWEHSWGVTAGISFTSTAGFDIGIASASASLTISAEIRYDGKKGGNVGTKRAFKFSDKTTVTIPPGKKATASLMVRKIENAEIEFTATIRRKVGGIPIAGGEFTQKGKWKGVMIVNSFVRTDEESA